jgi:RHS repeat-associated protein
VSQIVDLTSASGLLECFAYDGLNRLESAWSETGAACGTVAPASTNSTFDGSPTGLDTQWSYSATGKILTAINGAATPVTDTFAYTDMAHPSAVTQVVHTGGAAPVTDQFSYDAAGRMTARTTGKTAETPGGVSSGLVWDVSSNLVATTGAGGSRVYLYDASGQRVVQVRLDDAATTEVFEGTATAYFGATEVTDVSTDPAVIGDLAGTRYYTFGGATVAVRQTSPGVAATLSLVLGDYQGSAKVMMPLRTDSSGALDYAIAQDATDARATRNLYTPYGAIRGSGTPAQNDKLPISKGWLNQVSDEASTGLVYLNARYYDPAVARFVSPDPLMNPANPSTLDPYRYAGNNPVMFTDATGLFDCPAWIPNGVCDGYNDAAAASNKAAARPRAVVHYSKRWVPVFAPQPMEGIPVDPAALPSYAARYNVGAAALRQDMSSRDILLAFFSGDNHHGDWDGQWRFGNDDRYTDALRASAKHQGVIVDKLGEMSMTVGASDRYTATETTDIWAGPVTDLRKGLTLGADSPDLAETILGTYSGSVTVLQVDRKNGRVLVGVSATNDMSYSSLKRNPGRAWTTEEANAINDEPNHFPLNGMFRTIPMRVNYQEWYYGVS